MAEEKQLQNLWIAGKEWLGVDRLQLNKAHQTTVTTELEDGTQQENIVWEDSGEDIIFFDTSDATAQSTDIILDKTAYGTDGITNSQIKGAMLPLNLDASQKATPDDVYLQYSGKISDSNNSYIVPLGQWTFDLTKFTSITSNCEQVGIKFTLPNTSDSSTYTGIKFTRPSGDGEAYYSELSFQIPTGDDTYEWRVAAQGTSSANLEWQGQNWSGVPNPINLTELPSGGLNYDFYTFLITTATSDSDNMFISVKLGENAYIPGTGEHIRTFSVPGLATLSPSVIKQNIIIPGIHDSEGQPLKGTLQAATINKIDTTLIIE